ncbi:MAG: ParA family protein [Blastocatellia bacterium]|nr:ParA family protein [Blastocatellia bacterium]
MSGKKVIAVYNNAGGVAKTTTTRDLGYELSLRQKEVLLIDADFQGSLGGFLGRNPQMRPAQELFWNPICHDLESAPPIEKIYDHLWIGLANLQLARDEQFLAMQKNPSVLHRILVTLFNHFDYILIDCPPTINEISVQVLQAAQSILIPVQTEDKAFAGLELIQQEIIRANKRRAGASLPPLFINGLLPTRFNKRLVSHNFYLEEIWKKASELKCQKLKPIREQVAVQEACNKGLPLKLYAPNSSAIPDIEELAQNILTIN